MSFTPPSSDSAGRLRRRGFVGRIEWCCSRTITNLPLAFVYGLTTWAIYVEVSISLAWATESKLGYVILCLGVLLYLLLNWSYTVTSFTDPGSPSSPYSPSDSSARHGYSYLPTHESTREDLQSLTVKSSGGTRYCKKCQTKKPDRAHHCSSCGRCVLKMDHHCPWLATCVGFRNYKPFILFCTYVTLFCWVCFGVSGTFLWTKLLDADLSQNAAFGINTVLLVVLSGIFGLVLTGFTGWHLSLAWRNQTTIECLEKTRYLAPIRRGLDRAHYVFQTRPGEDPTVMQKYGQQLTELHANAVPGVTRPEEGDERQSPVTSSHARSDQLTAMEALQMNYNEMERERERQRYQDYLDEKDSDKLPNAFDLGWRKNLILLFGHKKLFWLLPICNSIGDGWNWEPSARWLAERERIREERESLATNESPHRRSGVIHSFAPRLDESDDDHRYLSTTSGITSVPTKGRRSPGKANQILGRSSRQYTDDYIMSSVDMPLRTLKPRQNADDTSSTDGLYSRDDDTVYIGDEGVPEGSQRSLSEWREDF